LKIALSLSGFPISTASQHNWPDHWRY